MLDDSMNICVVCNKRIKSGNNTARRIDGLWLCSHDCISSFLKEKKKWSAENWDAICKLQATYEEKKRIETGGNLKSAVR